MPRTQPNQSKPSLQYRLARHALRLKEEAQALRPGPERDALIRRARHAETASHVDDWLLSPASSRLGDSRSQMQHKGTQCSVVQTVPSKLGHTEARQGSETAMDVKRSQSISSDALPVECHDLHRQMAEVLALREKVASLEKVRKKTRRRAKASDPCTVERRPRSVL